MLSYDLAKDIVIPLLAPLGAALAVVVAFLRREHQMRRVAAGALYRDLDWLWQHYSLVAGSAFYEKKPTLRMLLVQSHAG